MFRWRFLAANSETCFKSSSRDYVTVGAGEGEILTCQKLGITRKVCLPTPLFGP